MLPSKSNEETQEMAALYALGALTQHEARAIEAYLAEGSYDLAEELSEFEAVTAHMALAVPERIPPVSLRDKLIARISEEQQLPAREAFHLPITSSQQLSQMYSLHADESGWQEICPGMATKTLFVDRSRGTVTSLVRMAPGSALPPHRHLGDEQFYVLEGDCNVHGTKLGPGDFHRAPAGSIHESTYTDHGTMFLLIAPADYEILQPVQ